MESMCEEFFHSSKDNTDMIDVQVPNKLREILEKSEEGLTFSEIVHEVEDALNVRTLFFF